MLDKFDKDLFDSLSKSFGISTTFGSKSTALKILHRIMALAQMHETTTISIYIKEVCLHVIVDPYAMVRFPPNFFNPQKLTPVIDKALKSLDNLLYQKLLISQELDDNGDTKDYGDISLTPIPRK